MEGSVSLLDSVPANQVPPAPVLPRLPLHLLKQNDKTHTASKPAAPGLEGSITKAAAKEARPGKPPEGRSSQNLGKVISTKLSNQDGAKKEGNIRPMETNKALNEGPRSIAGSNLGLHLKGSPDPAGLMKRLSFKSTQHAKHLPAERTDPIAMTGVASQSVKNKPPLPTNERLEATHNSPSVSSSTADDSRSVSGWGIDDKSATTVEPSVLLSSKEQKQANSPTPFPHNSASAKSNQRDKLASVTAEVIIKHGHLLGRQTPENKLQSATSPDAHYSMARTLDWDAREDEHFVIGQNSAGFDPHIPVSQPVGLFDDGESRFAVFKVEGRNLLQSSVVRLDPAILAKNRGSQEKTFGRPASARSELKEVMLDGFLLCDAAGVELPEEAEVVNLCGKHLTTVEENDLRFFKRLSAVNAADNYLRMESFGGLAALTRLLLPCNKLERLRFQPGQFDILEVLDVSFNHLTRTDISLLSTLPRLLELYFDHNPLAGHLPPDVSLPGRFGRLQKLSLSANGLPSGAMTILSKLPSLRSLSLARNPLRRIPWESVAHETLFPSLTELDVSGTRIEEAEGALGLIHLSKRLHRVALWDTPLATRAGSDGNGEALESALPILATIAEAAEQGQRWILVKPKPRPKPALFGGQVGATVEEFGKEQLADLAAVLPETQMIAALERVRKRFEEAPVEAQTDNPNFDTDNPAASTAEGRLKSKVEESAEARESEPLAGTENDDRVTSERELYQLANAPTPAGGLPHIDDTSAAVLALKYALKHPLVKTNIHPEHHQQLNTIAKIRLEETIRRQVPLSPTRRLTQNEVEQTIQEAKKEEMAASIEDILAKMKTRLTHVEKKLRKAGQKV